MRELPILMQEWGVRASLEGRKTQTRRVIKPQPERHHAHLEMRQDSERIYFADMKYCYEAMCPYGQPGDGLWVRETWSPWADASTQLLVAKAGEKVIYREDYLDGALPVVLGGDYHWHPSIHMPKWAARLWLEVKAVRVERVQDITPQEIEAEGLDFIEVCERHWVQKTANGYPYEAYAEAMEREFISLWNSINAKRGFGWDVNPWVWVIEYERIEQRGEWAAKEQSNE